MVHDRAGRELHEGDVVEFVYGGEVHRTEVLVCRRPPVGPGSSHGEVGVELRVWIGGGHCLFVDDDEPEPDGEDPSGVGELGEAQVIDVRRPAGGRAVTRESGSGEAA